MSYVHKTVAIGVLIAGFTGASSVLATPLSPQIDFRSGVFAAADGAHSFTTTIDGITLTLEAFADNGASDATLWWDSTDGIGVRGLEDDEVDPSERLVLSFASTIGLSHIFLSDLFATETFGGNTYSESGYYTLDGGPAVSFSAIDLLATDGNKSNGEQTLVLDKITPVGQIVFSAMNTPAGQNYSLLGFTDPPLPQLPEPGTLSLIAFGSMGLWWTRRRRKTARV